MNEEKAGCSAPGLFLFPCAWTRREFFRSDFAAALAFGNKHLSGDDG
jgi:hypothetical protein